MPEIEFNFGDNENHNCIGVYDWYGGKNVFVCKTCGCVIFVYHDETRVPRVEVANVGDPNVGHKMDVGAMVNITSDQIDAIFGEGASNAL